MVLVSEEKRLVTGASDSELRAWDIAYLQEVITVSSEHLPMCAVTCRVLPVS